MTVYYYSKNPNGYITGRRFSIDRPAATVMAHGMAGDHQRSIRLTDDGEKDRPPMTDPTKPPYCVLPMSEIAKIRWNGLTVVSTFAGCGGSSTGYRMAGFRVLLANEFMPIAQESYAANMGPHTVLAREDVKLLTGAMILERTGLKVGELDVLDGSPPCQAFSTAGRREKGWGTDKQYEHGAAQKNEQLFDEFVRLLRELRPRTFVAENVSGLVKGAAKGFFINILAALKAAGYAVTCRKLDAQWLGVPQARERVIFVGVRDDLAALGFAPAFPAPLPYNYSVREALPWLGPARLVTAGNERHTEAGRRPMWNADTSPSPTIMATPAGESYRVVHDTRGSFKSGGDITDRPSVTIMSSPFDAHHFQVYRDEQIVGVGANAGFGKSGMQSPDLPARTIGCKPDSGNARSAPGMVEVRKIANGDVVPDNVAAGLEGYAVGAEWDKLNPGQQSDKFFSLVRPDADKPCPTVTSQGTGGGGSGAPGGVASVTHPTEKRKFTIAELRRICGFPDDFVLKGSYAQQWERLGNSVPPVMMFHVAAAIRDAVLIPARARTSGPARRSAGRSTTGKPPKGAGKRPPGGAPGASRTAAAPAGARTPGRRSRPAGRAAEGSGGPS